MAMTSTQEYILDVPATKTAILKLITELMENHPEETCTTDRVVLQFGTCQLLCRDETERAEFKNKVTVLEAFRTLCEADREAESS